MNPENHSTKDSATIISYPIWSKKSIEVGFSSNQPSLHNWTQTISDLVPEKQLFTIVVGRIIASKTNSSNYYHELIDQCVNENKGNPVQYSSNIFTITFNSTSKAVSCSFKLQKMMSDLKVQISIGIQIKECEPTHCIDLKSQSLAISLLEECPPNQILLTQTVRNLISEIKLRFIPHKTIFDSNTLTSIILYQVSRLEDELVTKESSYSSKQGDLLTGKIYQIIHKHLSNENFNVTALCRELKMSERQLQRKLKAVIQKTPNQLIASIRLTFAKELLQTTRYTISEIAFKIGFSDPSYFSKCFKKEFNVNPSALKAVS